MAFQKFTADDDSVADYQAANDLLASLEEVRNTVIQLLEPGDDVAAIRSGVITKWWNELGESLYGKCLFEDPDIDDFLLNGEVRITLYNEMEAILPGVNKTLGFGMVD